MVALFLIASWTSQTLESEISGLATYYSEGLMQRVADNRNMDLRFYDGGVALNSSGDLGRSVWLEWGDGIVTGPFLVVDCAQKVHYGARQDENRIVEVSAEVAKERGFYGVGPVPVTVHFGFPADWIFHPR